MVPCVWKILVRIYITLAFPSIKYTIHVSLPFLSPLHLSFAPSPLLWTCFSRLLHAPRSPIPSLPSLTFFPPLFSPPLSLLACACIIPLKRKAYLSLFYIERLSLPACFAKAKCIIIKFSACSLILWEFTLYFVGSIKGIFKHKGISESHKILVTLKNTSSYMGPSTQRLSECGSSQSIIFQGDDSSGSESDLLQVPFFFFLQADHIES